MCKKCAGKKIIQWYKLTRIDMQTKKNYFNYIDIPDNFSLPECLISLIKRTYVSDEKLYSSDSENVVGSILFMCLDFNLSLILFLIVEYKQQAR